MDCNKKNCIVLSVADQSGIWKYFRIASTNEACRVYFDDGCGFAERGDFGEK